MLPHCSSPRTCPRREGQARHRPLMLNVSEDAERRLARPRDRRTSVIRRNGYMDAFKRNRPPRDQARRAVTPASRLHEMASPAYVTMQSAQSRKGPADDVSVPDPHAAFSMWRSSSVIAHVILSWLINFRRAEPASADRGADLGRPSIACWNPSTARSAGPWPAMGGGGGSRTAGSCSSPSTR